MSENNYWLHFSNEANYGRIFVLFKGTHSPESIDRAILMHDDDALCITFNSGELYVGPREQGTRRIIFSPNGNGAKTLWVIPDKETFVTFEDHVPSDAFSISLERAKT